MKKKKEIHVVYIITKLELGGAQKVCLSLLQNLPQQDISTYLITGNSGLLLDKVRHLPQIQTIACLKREITPWAVISEIKTFFELIKKLRALKKENSEVIVHTHSTKAGLLGRWAAFFAGITTRTHTIHGYGFHHYQNPFTWTIIYLLELLTSYITSHFVCVSSQDVKTGIRLFPHFAKKHSIIRAAIDDGQFRSVDKTPQPFPGPAEHFIFGSLSCFKPQKNIIDLLKAFAVVHHKNSLTKLEIIGDGVQRPDVEKWIRTHDLTHAITLHGWQDSVASLMRHWHAFTLSSLWEGLPCSIIEARMLKLPILCYDTGGIKDVVAHGGNGFLYAKKNWQGLSEGMLELTSHEELYYRFAHHQEDLSNFQQPVMIAQHYDLYQILTQSSNQKINANKQLKI